MQLTLIFIFCWLVFAFAEGYIHARLFDFRYKANRAKIENYSDKYLHWWFILQRSASMLPAVVITINLNGWLDGLKIFTAMALLHPLIHNGIMFHFRNVIDKEIYPHGFLDDGSTINNKSVFDFDFITRFIMFLIGSAIIVISILNI